MEKYRVLIVGFLVLFALLVLGTAVFKALEDFSWIDAFYFSGSTLTTLGYGDYVPLTSAGKVFTVFYSLIGIGVVFFVSSTLALLMVKRIRIPRRRPRPRKRVTF